MGSETTLETVRKAIVDLGVAPELVTAEATLRGDLELDSTELIEVTLEVRRALGVEIKLELGEDLTVDDIRATVDKALSNQ